MGFGKGLQAEGRARARQDGRSSRPEAPEDRDAGSGLDRYGLERKRGKDPIPLEQRVELQALGFRLKGSDDLEDLASERDESIMVALLAGGEGIVRSAPQLVGSHPQGGIETPGRRQRPETTEGNTFEDCTHDFPLLKRLNDPEDARQARAVFGGAVRYATTNQESAEGQRRRTLAHGPGGPCAAPGLSACSRLLE